MIHKDRDRGPRDEAQVLHHVELAGDLHLLGSRVRQQIVDPFRIDRNQASSIRWVKLIELCEHVLSSMHFNPLFLLRIE